MKYLLILLVLTTGVLLLPYKKLSAVKKALCALTVAFAAAFAVQALLPQVFVPKATTPVTITAKGETVSPAEGCEIWIKSVKVDGKTYSPREVFANGWIEKDGLLGWRNYDTPTNLSNSVQGELPAGKDRSIIFKANKWQGNATVSVNGSETAVNCYTPGEQDGETAYQAPAETSPARSVITPQIQKTVFCVLLLAVFFFVLFLFFLDSKKKAERPVPLSQNNRRIIWIDALKIASCFAIIIIHSIATAYTVNYSGNIKEWYNTLYLNSLTRFAVPCFLMISGLIILTKNDNLEVIFKKRLPRLVIPLVFWSICHIFINIYMWKKDQVLWEEILTIPFQQKDGHLWYIYQLIELYLIAPFLCVLYRNITKRQKQYFILITLLFPSFIDVVLRLKSISVGDYMGLNWSKIGLGEIGLCFLAKYLYDEYQDKEMKKWIAPVGMFASFSALVLCSYFVTLKNNQPNFDFFEQLRFPSVLFGAFTFLLFYSLKDKFDNISEKVKEIITKLSNLTMGVYFIHILVAVSVGERSFGILHISMSSRTGIEVLLSAIVYCIVSYMICYVLSFIPYLKKLVV